MLFRNIARFCTTRLDQKETACLALFARKDTHEPTSSTFAKKHLLFLVPPFYNAPSTRNLDATATIMSPSRQPRRKHNRQHDAAWQPATRALHTAYRSDPTTRASSVPLYQTVAYQFDDTAQAARLFALEEQGDIYTRLHNPTTAVLEERLAALEGGIGALAVSSGHAATAYAIQNLARVGDNIVSSQALYGGIRNFFAHGLRDLGIEVRFVNQDDPEAFRKASDERTRAFYGETLANPKLAPFPIREVGKIGEQTGIPLIIDNTVAPILCRPLDLGANIVTYSMTKYIGGHANAIGGLIVDGGNFDWQKHSERFPSLNAPDPNYKGVVFSELVKDAALEREGGAYIFRARVVLLRDLGASLSPFNSFLFLQGLHTLPLRMEAHSRNAQAVAEFLSSRSEVARVVYPGLLTGEARARARAVLQGGGGESFGGLLGFELKEGLSAGRKFIDELEMICHVANLGDVRTLAVHPASTTHGHLSAAEREESGVSEGYVRLSVGIEHIDDIVADLAQALARSGA